MLPEIRWSIEAPWAQGRLRVFEPTVTEVLAAAPLLAAFYNDSHNSAMMTNTHEMSVAEVVETFQAMRAAGDRPFLLEQDGELMGDADFRNIQGTEAEFAILVGHRAQQSRGLGTRYAAMMHVAALRVLGFERIYAIVIPMNIASRRMLEKLGYQVDQSARAVSFADAEDDIAMSIDRLQFEETHADLLTQVVITARAPSPASCSGAR
jgi:RimJ/RimL family protein N-acetyltransferase